MYYFPKWKGLSNISANNNPGEQPSLQNSEDISKNFKHCILYLLQGIKGDNGKVKLKPSMHDSKDILKHK